MGAMGSKGVFQAAAIPRDFSEIKMKDIRGHERSLSEWDGKVKLVVNVASKCGMTKAATADLLELREKFGPEAFEVLGFPCGQFAGQEYKEARETEAFCQRSNIVFPIFETSDVNGPHTNPVFLYCKANSDDFYSASAGSDTVQLKNIGWNYGKFLLDRRNGVYKYYGPRVQAMKLADDIIKLINGELSGMKRSANGSLTPS